MPGNEEGERAGNVHGAKSYVSEIIRARKDEPQGGENTQGAGGGKRSELCKQISSPIGDDVGKNASRAEAEQGD